MSNFIDFNNDFLILKEWLPKLKRDENSNNEISCSVDFENSKLKPRSLKPQNEQSERTQKFAEVFTPQDVCKMMIDELDGVEKTESRCIEIACGEAPFIVSRYDAATGEEIKIEDRIGILDRKLKFINENFQDHGDWLAAALKAFQSVYGFELQGDSLLIARINLFLTFIEYHKFKFPDVSQDDFLFKIMIPQIVKTITWNFWQMDGLEFFDIENDPQFGIFESITPVKKHEFKIKDWRNNKIFNFKDIKVEENKTKQIKKIFDFCISNPPYHEETKDTSDSPLYNLFMDSAFQIAEKVEFITPARFLFNAGKTPKAWNEKMLNDPHFKVLKYEPDSKKLFRNVDIKGGVAVTLRDETKDFGAIKNFTAFTELNSILHKVINDEKFDSIENLIVSQNKWDLDELYTDYPNLKMKIGSRGKERRLTTSIFNLTEVFHDEKHNDDVEILGLINNKRVKKYVNRKYLDEHENLDKYKIILPKSNGTGAIGEVLSTPLVGEPLVGYTQSFIGIGKFDTQDEAEALFQYIKTKFARCMLGVLKVTQDNPRSTWAYVPLQNFKNDSDIDWSKNIREIDMQLYKKYGLDDNETAFIESKVREMK